MKLQYVSPVASITVDCVIFGFDGKKIEILLIKRGSEPEMGKWALPGGFIEKEETLDDAATRVLSLLTGMSTIYMEQFHTFGSLNRHPLGRVITVAYYALVDSTNYKLQPSWHASETEWFDIAEIPKLGFDHKEIVTTALKTLKKEISIRPIGFELLPSKFTLTDLQNLYEVILGQSLDRRNFRRKLKAMDILIELDEMRPGAHIGATLYKFNKKRYTSLVSEGFDFRL
jgi:8-oxo-dGTP diphosphatase